MGMQVKIAQFKQREKPPTTKKRLREDVKEKVDAVPSFLNGRKLRDYQILSLQWMMQNFRAKKNCILGDEMVSFQQSNCSSRFCLCRFLRGQPFESASCDLCTPLNVLKCLLHNNAMCGFTP